MNKQNKIVEDVISHSRATENGNTLILSSNPESVAGLVELFAQRFVTLTQDQTGDWTGEVRNFHGGKSKILLREAND